MKHQRAVKWIGSLALASAVGSAGYSAAFSSDRWPVSREAMSGFAAIPGCPAITDYGASPADSDNTAAIQHAIYAERRNEGGGCLFVPPGRYRHSGTILVPMGMYIRGPMEFESSPHVAEFEYTGDDVAWKVTSDSTAREGSWVWKVRLTGFRIYSSTGRAAAGLWLDKASEGEIYRMAIGGGPGTGFNRGIHADGVGGFNIHDNRIQWNRVQILVEAYPQSASFPATPSAGNVIRRNDFFQGETAIELRSVAGLTIAENWSEANDVFVAIGGTSHLGRVLVEHVLVVGNQSVNDGDPDAPHARTRFFRMSQGADVDMSVRIAFEGNEFQGSFPGTVDPPTRGRLDVFVRFIGNHVELLRSAATSAWQSTRPEFTLVTEDNRVFYRTGAQRHPGSEFSGAGTYEPRHKFVSFDELTSVYANVRSGTTMYCRDCAGAAGGQCGGGGDGRQALRRGGQWRCY